MDGMLLIGSLVFVGIVLFGLIVMAYARAHHMEELARLEKHKRRLEKKEPGALEDNLFLQQRSDYLGKLLAQAGLESKYDQMRMRWVLFSIGGGVLLGIGGYFASPELSIVGLLIGLPLGAAAFVQYVKYLAKKRQDRLTEQLPQVLESMVGGLRAGSPVLEVFKILAETAPEPIRGEFKRALISLQLGKPFREVLDEMCTRIRTPDFRLLTQAIFISQDVGGNLSDVVATISDAIRERFKLRDFLNSLTAQGKMTALFISLLPYLIIAFMVIFAPFYIGPFFNNFFAKVIFGGMVLWELIGVYILMRLTTFEI